MWRLDRRNEDCTNWCSLGPLPGWLWSDDSGRSWHNSGHFPQGAPEYGRIGPDGRPIMTSDYHTSGGTAFGGLFGECKGHTVSQGNTWVEPCAVKFAYPRPVDYGQNNRHSPDGKLYFTAMGSSRPDGPVSWMSADETHVSILSACASLWHLNPFEIVQDVQLCIAVEKKHCGILLIYWYSSIYTMND